jgi:hypothetical protein
MNLNELEILEDDFDLFVALDDADKIEFLYDATEVGMDAAVIKHVKKMTDKFFPKTPIVSSEDFQVGQYRLCITSMPDQIQLNSNSLKAIRHFVKKITNDGIMLLSIDAKKSEFDLYRYFKAYKIIGRGDPLSSN